MTDGGCVTSTIYKGVGKAGDITIKADEYTDISGTDESSSSRIISGTIDSLESCAGKILIISPDITIEKGAYLNSMSIGAVIQEN